MQPTADVRERFWRWFEANGRRLQASMYGQDGEARQAASEELREAVAEFQPGLVLEFGSSGNEGVADLIASADGRRELVDGVKDFVASAPSLPGWNVVAFRPRMPIGASLVIQLEEEEIGASDVWFRVAEEEGLGLTLAVRGLTHENERLRGLGAMLLAEHAVGERDALTLLTALDLQPLPEDPASDGLRPFEDLVGVFDRTKARKYPPPGSLTFDREGEWMTLRGTLNGAQALILLNASLASAAGHPAYDRSLVVTIPLHEANEDGMPASEEEDLAVRDIGNRLTDELEKGQESLLGATVMTQGRRDLIFYTANAAAALDRIETVRAGQRTHALETLVERDSFWGLYRQFMQAAEEGEEDGE